MYTNTHTPKHTHHMQIHTHHTHIHTHASPSGKQQGAAASASFEPIGSDDDDAIVARAKAGIQVSVTLSKVPLPLSLPTKLDIQNRQTNKHVKAFPSF
jgi:hypothetical protein